MRAFILFALAATVYADIGYNYNAVSKIPSTGALNSLGGHTGSSGLSGHGGLSIGSGYLGGLGSSGLVGHTGGQSSPVSRVQSTPTTYEKEFYTFSAPDNEFDDQNAGQHISNVKKHLRVVFIKAPENKGLENAALQLAKEAADGKTAIYVLSKQADIGNLTRQVQDINSQSSNKPEVHFVKYRTPQDAANAQKVIKAQYDELSGNSKAHDGGVAPVLSFASQVPTAQGPGPKVPFNAYLPSSVLRLFRA
ncbi:uncharacterized protein LOC118738578 [Rhagoletis pomonella]|uniref:uncharacterized protein LOC118738578 n=1 Tax=Rhagoletis pomonella TaxID=28610 RepID=UPI0017875183|nr:uncharacterized protein LOC118738578 [Rhagoletis pomonella]